MPSGKRTYHGAFGGSQGSSKKARTGRRGGTSTKNKFITGKTAKATFRYAERVTISGNAVEGSLGTHVFSANGAYDPNVTGVGNQPRGFDELMALYDQYTVVKSKIEVRFANQNVSSRPYVGIMVRDTSSISSTVVDMMEYSGSKVSHKPLARSGGGDADADLATFLTSSCDVASFAGSKDALDNPELKGGAAKNPDEGIFYHICAGSVSDSSGVSVDALVTVTYDVILHEPKLPPPS